MCPRLTIEVKRPMVYNGLPLRHELKYYIPYADYLAIRGSLSAFLLPDENMSDTGGYHVRSLYFDDPVLTSKFEKINGYMNRNKTRIRIYNKNLSLIHFERKVKIGDLVGKHAASISKQELRAIINNDTGLLLRSENPLMHRFYVDQKLRRIRPIVMVDYMREAYTYTAGNVRVTFDHDLQAAYGDFDSSLSDDRLIYTNIYPPQLLAMEIKYDEFLPSAIKRLVRPYNVRRSAISKYILALRAIKVGEKYGIGGLFPAIHVVDDDSDYSKTPRDSNSGDPGRPVYFPDL